MLIIKDAVAAMSVIPKLITAEFFRGGLGHGIENMGMAPSTIL